MRALGVGLARASRRAFDPAGLFAPGAAGALYEPRPGAVFQDAGGTIAARIGDPVGRLADGSGNGNHAVQAAAGARPVLRRDAGGYPFLDFDGVDDALQSLFACPAFDRVSALRPVGATADNRLIGGGNANFGLLIQHGVTPGIAMYDGVLLIGTGPGFADGVIAERHRGATSELRVDDGPQVRGEAGSGSPGGITIGAHHAGGYASRMRMYVIVMIGRMLTDREMGSARRWAGFRAGLQL